MQLTRPLEGNLAELPCFCTVGTKRNSAGYKESWIGYKLHIDVADGDVPVSLILSAANLHDSQAAIPLAQMSHERALSLYDLMDSAYDSPQIVQFSHQLGHEPLIAHNPRGGEKREPPPAQQRKMPCSAVFSNTPRFQKCLSFAELEFRRFSRWVLQELPVPKNGPSRPTAPAYSSPSTS